MALLVDCRSVNTINFTLGGLAARGIFKKVPQRLRAGESYLQAASYKLHPASWIGVLMRLPQNAQMVTQHGTHVYVYLPR